MLDGLLWFLALAASFVAGFCWCIIVARKAGSTLHPAHQPADNLGQRVRTLMEQGAFDAQIERAIKRNTARRG